MRRPALLPRARMSEARFASTSFTFMLVWVPEPVCQTTSGKCSSSLPARASSAALMIARPFSRASVPSATLTAAAAFLTSTCARTTSIGIVSPGKWKCARLRCVCAPHSLSAGTSMLAMVSCSMRTLFPISDLGRWAISSERRAGKALGLLTACRSRLTGQRALPVARHPGIHYGERRHVDDTPYGRRWGHEIHRPRDAEQDGTDRYPVAGGGLEQIESDVRGIERRHHEQVRLAPQPGMRKHLPAYFLR